MRKFRHVPKMPGHRISPWRQLLCSLLMGLLLALAVIVWINLQLRPMVLAVSDAHFSNEMSLIISRALDEADDTLPSYSDLAELHYDENGMLAAVTTNMEAGNLLRSRLVTDLLPGLSAMEEETVAIPAGSLTGLTLLSGHGFSIPVKLLGVTNIRSRLDSTLTAAGINQTLHRIDLVVEAALILTTVPDSIGPGAALPLPAGCRSCPIRKSGRPAYRRCKAPAWGRRRRAQWKRPE